MELLACLPCHAVKHAWTAPPAPRCGQGLAGMTSHVSGLVGTPRSNISREVRTTIGLDLPPCPPPPIAKAGIVDKALLRHDVACPHCNLFGMRAGALHHQAPHHCGNPRAPGQDSGSILDHPTNRFDNELSRSANSTPRAAAYMKIETMCRSPSRRFVLRRHRPLAPTPLSAAARPARRFLAQRKLSWSGFLCEIRRHQCATRCA